MPPSLTTPRRPPNDRYVALTLLKNAEIAAQGILPMCQDTGTAAVFAKKGEQVWTGANDAEWLSRGVYECFTRENLRYSQVAPLDMWNEANTGTNLPAQIDIQAKPGPDYELLFIAKGGGSANKMLFFQETKALLNPSSFAKFVADKLPLLGTSACPPYHLVFVVGGTSAEACMKTLKLASTRYFDSLPTSGNALGRAFRDTAWEAKVLEIARQTGIGAQFGGKYFALDARVIRLARHGAGCPVGMGVSCSADRNIKARITRDGIFLEKLDADPGRFIPAAERSLKDTAGVPDRPQPPDGGDPRRAFKVPGDDAGLPERADGRRPRRGARQVQGAAGRRQGPARLPQAVSGLLRRPGQDPEGVRLGIIRPNDGRPDGQLRRPFAVPRAARW